MPENKYLVRAPLMDPKQHVSGYKLAWRGLPPSSDLEDVRQLLAFANERVPPGELGLLFLDSACGIPRAASPSRKCPGARC
jgi:hypothetical protein